MIRITFQTFHANEHVYEILFKISNLKKDTIAGFT